MIVRKAEALIFMGKAASIAAADEALLDMLMPMCEAAVFRYLQLDLSYRQHVELLPAGSPYSSDDRPLTDAQFRANAAVFVNGNPGTSTLVLRHSPVWIDSIEVREDVAAHAGQAESAFDDASVLVRGSDYWLDTDEIIGDAQISRTGILHRFGVWSNEPRSVKVSYFGGETAARLAGASSDIKLAILHTIAGEFWAAQNNAKTSGSGPYAGESLGKYSYTLGAAGSSIAAQSQANDIPYKAKALLQSLKSWRYR